MATHPVFPNCLRYVREHRNLSLRQVADELGTSQGKLAQFESGDAVPTLRQYGLLQAIYGVPDYQLAGRDVPDLAPVVVDLRHAQASPLEISPKGLKAYFARSAAAELIDSIAASLQINPELKRPLGTRASNIVSRVEIYHKLLDFDPKKPPWVDSPELTLRYLRAKVEKFGIYCFMAEVPPTDYRGLFTRISDRASLILINKRTFKVKARLFTLIHEFAHFLLDLEGASDPLILRNREERACNEFASHFLAPPDLIAELLTQATKRTTSPETIIAYVSRGCLLSQGAVAYRLRQDGTITDNAYREWFKKNGFPPNYGAEETADELEAEAGPGGGQYAYNLLSDFGFRPFQILEKALGQHAIDDVHVAHIINARGPTQDLVFKTAKDRLAELGL